jgi:hypothetical protein
MANAVGQPDHDEETLLEAWGSADSARAVHPEALAADPDTVLERAFGELGETLDLELGQAMARYALAMPFTWFELLGDLGLEPGLRARLCALAGLGRARVSERDGLWSEDPGGAPRLIVPVWDQGWLCDLVALSSTDPDAWSLRSGHGVLLGQGALDHAGVMGEGHLRIHGTVLGWLQQGCAGICVLRWGAEALGRLRGLPRGVTLLADDRASAEALGRMLAHGALPRVDWIGRSTP